MSTSTIGINLYSLRQFTQTPADAAQTLHKVKQMGYDYVQISGFGPIDPKDLRKMLDSEGLGVCATHVSYTDLRDKMDEVIEKHKIWGCKNVGLGALPLELRNRDGFTRFAKEGTAFAATLAKAGLTFSYHNHSFEFERFDGRTGMEIIFEESDPKLLFAEIDTYWVQNGGGDPIAWIKRLKGREPLVHLKDMAVVDGKVVFGEVGEGNLNWPGILAACKEAGVEWYIVEQDSSLRDSFESVAMSLRNLKSWGLK
jgi:sugar phosphate isomerase/epimerase